MTEPLNLSRDNHGIRLNIELGSRMRFVLADSEEPVNGVLVGLAPWEYLIARLDLPAERTDHARNGAPVDVRYISLGNEYGFSSTITHRIDTPDRLIFIAYPDMIQNIDIRKSSRVSCFIPATALLDNRRIKGSIIDISRGGCRFIIRLPATLQPRQLKLVDTMTLRFPLMGIDGIQTFTCQVRTTSIDRERIAMGVEFIAPDRKLTEHIDRYIHMIAQIQQVQ